MKTNSELIARQYNRWAYPQPVPDLAAHYRRGAYDANDPSLVRRRLWPRPTEPEDLDVLVAGCGTYQAAFLAFTNPRCRVTGIDVSDAALAHELHLRRRHSLQNLEVRELDVTDAAALGNTFDYVVCTGVLHHLADPDAGLRALARVLRPGGVLSLMLYGRYNRAGVYTLKELFGRIGLTQDEASVDVIKATLATLPPWHHARSYLGTAPDLTYDSGIVDTFLHPQDRAYAVPEILQLVTGAGLTFQGWLDPGVYALQEALAGNHPLAQRAQQLSKEEQWSVVELMTQGISCHRFLACRPERPERDYRPDFAGAVMKYRPALTHGASIDATHVLTRGTRRAQLTAAEAGWLRRADGEKTLADLLMGAPRTAAAAAVQLVEDLYERGHLVFGF